MTPDTSQGGFTLIELVVVIALLALVAAIAVPSAGRLIDLSSPSDDVERLAAALRQARMAAIVEGRPRHVFIDPARRQWRHGKDVGTFDSIASITTAVPLDPWNHPYLYKRSDRGTSGYSLQSLGADGKAGGEGEDADIAAPSSTP